MKHIYNDLARRLWHVHSVAPLRASDIALYFLLLHEAHRNGWRMPIHVANGLIVPMLFEKGTLEQARKRLVEHGLIEYTKPKGNCSVPSYKIMGMTDLAEDDTIARKAFDRQYCAHSGKQSFEQSQVNATDHVDSELFNKAVSRVWTAFDDMALNANELALYFYILNVAEQAEWQMPVRFRDAAVAPLMMHLSALRKAREELARRRLVTFDLGDPKRTVPKYSIVMDGKQAAANSSKSACKPLEKKVASKPVNPSVITTDNNKEPLGKTANKPSPVPSAKRPYTIADKHDEKHLHGVFGNARTPDDYDGSFR